MGLHGYRIHFRHSFEEALEMKARDVDGYLCRERSTLWVFLWENECIQVYEFKFGDESYHRPYHVRHMGKLFGKNFHVFNSLGKFNSIMGTELENVIGVVEFTGMNVNLVSEIDFWKVEGKEEQLLRKVLIGDDEKKKWFIKNFYGRICDIHKSLMVNEEDSDFITCPYF